MIILLLVVTLFSGLMKALPVKAETDASLSKIEQIFQVDIEADSEVSLYDHSDKVVAYFYKLLPSGYIIVDAVTFGVIEASFEHDNKYITDLNKTYYYSGPLSYFETYLADENYVINSVTNEVIEKARIIFKSAPSLEETLVQAKEQNYFSTLDEEYKTPYLLFETKPYNTNTGGRGICGATAAAIMLEYFYSHINSSVLSPIFFPYGESDDGVCLTEVLANNYIKGSATIYDIKTGLNKFFEMMVIPSLKADYVTEWNILTKPTDRMEFEILADWPCIIGLTKEPTYGEHWVVAIGFQKEALMAEINDGWGNTGIWVLYHYIDSCAYLY